MIECTRDGLGQAIGQEIAAIVSREPNVGGMLVIDPFAGSANTLYWIMRQLPAARVLGFELDVRIFQLSQQNATILKLPIEMVNIDYQAGLACVSLASDDLLIAFIAPPWGEALSRTSGLDLRATTPAVPTSSTA